MLKRRESGMFTVEAAVLMPFLIILTFSAILFIIYFYDRAMVVQDVNGVFADVRAGNNESALMNHPYILLSDMEMAVSRSGNKLTVRIGGNWTNPIYGKLLRRIEFEKTEWIINPADIMKIMRDLAEKAEVINVSNKDNP